MKWRSLRWSSAALLLALLAACSSKSSEKPAQDRQAVNVFAGSTDLAVGKNRFPFFLLDFDGKHLENLRPEVAFVPVQEEGKGVVKSVVPALYRRVLTQFPHTHEGGQIHLHEEARGYYLVDRALFDAAGPWVAIVTFQEPATGKAQSGTLAFEVKERSATPAVGERVPATRNPTAADVADLAEIDSSPSPRRELHEVSVAQALERRRPFVVVFATPAFCVSRLCGPVTEEVASLYPKYHDRADFVHIEPYELGPLRREGVFRLSPPTKEWNLPTEPWVFVVDREGRLLAKFEGLVSADEVEAAVQKALAG